MEDKNYRIKLFLESLGKSKYEMGNAISSLLEEYAGITGDEAEKGIETARKLRDMKQQLDDIFDYYYKKK